MSKFFKTKEGKDECVFIFTDGGVNGNPGNAGAGIFIIYPDFEHEISKHIGVGTNNYAELKAIKRGLMEVIKRRCTNRSILLYTDSKYSLGVLNNNNWNPTKNLKLIKSTQKLMKRFKNLKMLHVKGHSGFFGNEKADNLATFGKNKVIINRKTKTKKFQKR